MNAATFHLTPLFGPVAVAVVALGVIGVAELRRWRRMRRAGAALRALAQHQVARDRAIAAANREARR